MKNKVAPLFPRLLHGILTVLLFLSLGLAFERPARAYVDPGTGLLVLQSLGALASGVAFYCRRSIKRLFTRTPAEPEPGLDAAASAAGSPVTSDTMKDPV